MTWLTQPLLTQFVGASATSLLVWGWATHMVVDWLAQNDWQAKNKMSLRHGATYLHSGLHALALWLLFPLPFALLIGVLHLLIDTRVPLRVWSTAIRQTKDGPVALHVALWSDQALHVLVLMVVAFAAAQGRV